MYRNRLNLLLSRLKWMRTYGVPVDRTTRLFHSPLTPPQLYSTTTFLHYCLTPQPLPPAFVTMAHAHAGGVPGHSDVEQAGAFVRVPHKRGKQLYQGQLGVGGTCHCHTCMHACTHACARARTNIHLYMYACAYIYMGRHCVPAYICACMHPYHLHACMHRCRYRGAHACMHAWIQTLMPEYMHAHKCACIRTCKHTHVCASVRIHVCTYMCLYMHACMHAHVYVCMHMCVYSGMWSCTCACMHPSIDTYMHTYMHSYLQILHTTTLIHIYVCARSGMHEGQSAVRGAFHCHSASTPFH